MADTNTGAAGHNSDFPLERTHGCGSFRGNPHFRGYH